MARKRRKKKSTHGAQRGRMPAHLRRSYLTGKVAARIGWGSPGQFNRCVAQARKHGMGRMAKGACARLYHAKTGRHPGPRSRS